jgi:hypothetical protein
MLCSRSNFVRVGEYLLKGGSFGVRAVAADGGHVDHSGVRLNEVRRVCRRQNLKEKDCRRRNSAEGKNQEGERLPKARIKKEKDCRRQESRRRKTVEGEILPKARIKKEKDCRRQESRRRKTAEGKN